jgi:hypothetical protein
MPETIADDRDLDLAYQAIARDPKYAHFINIPERIIRCLDYFGIACNPVEVRQRLRSYYLFIGVVDEAIDSSRLEIGKHVLDRFHNQVPCFDDRTLVSRVGLVTEVLKRDIKEGVYQKALTKLRELYGAVAKERKAETIAAYIEQRKVVGHLTAELSYVLIRSFLEDESSEFFGFLGRVGAVGCLVDSAIDLSSDAHLGLLAFNPTMGDRLELLFSTISEGLIVSMKYPALLPLFLEAVMDNVRDRFRFSAQVKPRFTASPAKGSVPSVS